MLAKCAVTARTKLIAYRCGMNRLSWGRT
jgi:hypothetical protein